MIHTTEGRDLHRNGAASGSPEDSPQLVIVQETQAIQAKTSHAALPAFLRFRFDVHGKAVTLNLRKNSRLNGNIPIYFEGPDGPTLVETEKMENVAFYQDIQGGAAITVTTDPGVSKATKSLEGTFLLDGIRMSIVPEAKSVRTIAEFLLKRTFGEEVDGELHLVSRATHMAGNGVGDLVDDFTQSKTADAIVNDTASFDESTGESKRRRRQTSGGVARYDVEIMFVVDYTVWDFWVAKEGTKALKHLKNYLFHQFNGMDLAYQRIDTNQWGLQITLWLKQLRIAKTAAKSPWVQASSVTQLGDTPETTYVDVDKVITKLGKWATNGQRTWSNPDHAMLWTRYNLRDDSLVGYAPVAGICRSGAGVSVVEDTGLHAWATAAHELGHNLGAGHDDGSGACAAEDRFIMTPIGGAFNTDNAFMFSPCSIRDFKAVLSGDSYGYPRVCLYNDVCQDGMDVATLNELMDTTDIYSPDEQCRVMKGEGYSTCYDPGEVICEWLFCSTGSGQPCYGYSPGGVDGTSCGDNKVCLMGRCQDKTTAGDTGSGTCVDEDLSLPVPAGCDDNAAYVLNIQLQDGSVVPSTCQDIVRDYPEFCFTHSMTTVYCCRSCHLAGLAETT